MIREAIQLAVDREDLTSDMARTVMDEIMTGSATPSQIASFITAIRMKGESRDELLGFAVSMRERARTVRAPENAIDLCGTGGDGAKTFNISTAASFAVAAAGVPVAKHGNRAISSSSGSADVLSALGIPVSLGPSEVERCIAATGIGFMFAPEFHRSMRNVMGPRREIGIRTFFNILGPLLNPAGVKRQLIGVYDPALAPVIADVLRELGAKHAMIVHGSGMDEVTNLGRTDIVELVDGETRRYDIGPEDLGLAPADIEDLTGGVAMDNARTMISIFSGEQSPRADVVKMNSAAALVVSGRASDMREGFDIASDAISNGAALAKLRQFSAACVGIESEYQKGCEAGLLSGRRIMPNTLKTRARDMTRELESEICVSEEGQRLLENIDRSLIDDPSVLSVLTLSRMKSVCEGVGVAQTRRSQASRRLSDAITSAQSLAVIGEYKPRSPSSGALEVPPPLEEVAEAYTASGINAVSVLAEEEFFGGGADLFAHARSRLALPMLFKDFVSSKHQVSLARDLGADAILLITKALTTDALDELVRASVSEGLEPVVEVHDAVDIEKVASSSAYDSIEMIGINGRDLQTLAVSLGRAAELKPRIDDGKIVIAESGIKSPQDVKKLSGFDAVLIGTLFMQAEDIRTMAREIVQAAREVPQ